MPTRRRRPRLGHDAQLAHQVRHVAGDYLAAFRENLEKFAERIKPQLVFFSAGFDAHRLDPVGDLGLETEDFLPLTSLVLDVADTYAGGKVVSVLEGGYDPAILSDCVELHLAEMLKRQRAPQTPRCLTIK